MDGLNRNTLKDGAIRDHFPILDREVHGHKLVFLDSAASVSYTHLTLPTT